MREVREVSVLLIDLRKFKEVNDRWGHLTGDRVLRQYAELICRQRAHRGPGGAYGGDEFLVVLADTTRAEAERSPPDPGAGGGVERAAGGGRARLILDIGVDTAQQSEFQQLLDRADERMYACKYA